MGEQTDLMQTWVNKTSCYHCTNRLDRKHEYTNRLIYHYTNRLDADMSEQTDLLSMHKPTYLSLYEPT
ncbi:hypothetical protein ACSQ6I_23420 [Anabaena sp. WFMT]|uniref:hypothetical protein n=1 Tax=Anabaena sp. WFMT TaxID=3449730 RepID=UPI003F27B8AC